MGTEKYKILVVDDEQIERMLLVRRIEKAYTDRVEVKQAQNGREAVQFFQEDPADIVIMDISMPEMNGVMAAKYIRELNKKCSVIFLSAYDDYNYTRNALKVKALDYLLKPCEMSDLLAVLDEGMRLADLNRENRTERGSLIEEQDPDLYEEYEPKDSDGNGFMIAAQMREYITDHYMEQISMQDAAKAIGYSDAYFCKLFKQYFNQNFTAYLTNYRVQEAKRLLDDSKYSIKEIGSMVGYPDSNYFTKIFKRIEGKIPSKYREE